MANKRGYELRRSRREARLTQIQVAKLLGVTERTVRAWETDHTPIPLGQWKLFNILISDIKKETLP